MLDSSELSEQAWQPSVLGSALQCALRSGVCVGACRGSCGGMGSRLWGSLQLPIRFKPLGFFCWWEAVAGSQGSQELFVFLGSAKGFTLRETSGEGAAPQH